MSSAENYRQKVEQLQQHIDKAKAGEGSKGSKSKPIPYAMIGAAAIPVVVGGSLWAVSPSMVQEETEDGETKRSPKKVLFWTVVITVIVYVALFIAGYCMGKNPINYFKLT